MSPESAEQTCQEMSMHGALSNTGSDATWIYSTCKHVLAVTSVNKMRFYYDNKSLRREWGMRPHGKYKMGQILHGTDQISTRVIRTFGLRIIIISFEWITARGTGAISLYVTSSKQTGKLAGSTAADLECPFGNIDQAPILTDPRSDPLIHTLLQEQILKLIWDQVQHIKPWLALFMFLLS